MAVERRTSRDIRSESRLDVMHALLSAEEATRNELARSTGLSPATVATVVGDLLSEGIVTESRLSAGRVGRPTASLRINADRGRVVGIDVAETYVRAIVFDAALDEVAAAETPRDEHESSPEYVVEGIGRTFDAALARAGVDAADVLGVGVALPGIVQRASGVAVVVPHWSWRSVELDSLRDRIGVPLVLDNPLKAIATAELWFGTGRGADSMVTVNLGTGVGAGIVLEGRILRGATNAAGEWGHSLLAVDGRHCRCGRSGCVEAYVGAPGIQQTLREIAPEHPLCDLDLQREFIQALARASAADAPDPAVEETLATTARYLGSALADLVAVVNPERVTLTGWTTWAIGDRLLPLARARLVEEAPGVSAAGLSLEISTVRGNSVATGVAMIALERFLGDVGLVTTRAAIAL
ncbi:ROK family protein [Isoptericola sp. QY 916]|uniref:ROK family protein n=1 Tax=Isoptericola sp. QY 916 TaxID=2782570 RepID=UPI003D2FD544|nr:ROK family transcriptional regulator [Isoptericola sp. QY 916]